MRTRILWSICGLLTIILVWQIIWQSGLAVHAVKKISGVNVNLPAPDKNALVRPPEKTSDSIDPQIYARSSILIDVSSSYIMYSKDSEQKVPVASTTKIMTALVVLENYGERLNDIVEITYPMVAVEGSDIQLKMGEKITVENLLKGLLIMSGNDTAFALAIHFEGKDAFVSKMNKKAVELGLENTYFKDPAGLDDEGYSTAHDLAVLASYGLRNSQLREIVKTPETIITSVDGRFAHELKSSNRMIRSEEQLFFPFAIGIKTGFTNEAGHCLVSAAEKDGHEILGVVLNTNENSITASAKESKKLLEWGFNNWTWN